MALPRFEDIVCRLGADQFAKQGRLYGPRYDDILQTGEPTFSRADGTPRATYRGSDKKSRLALTDKLRTHWVDPGTGVLKPGLLFESTRQNKLDNGDVEADAVGWVANVSAAVRDSTQAYRGAWAVKVTTTNATSSGVFVRLRSGARPAVTATSNRLHTWSVAIFAPAASVGKTIKIRVEWWDVTPAFISASQVTGIVLVAGWQEVTITAAAAVGAVTADVFVGGDNAQGVWDFWADAAQFEEGAYRSTFISTGTASLVRADDKFIMPISLDMAADFSIYLYFLPHHGNVATWPDTEPQLDPCLFCLMPAGSADGYNGADALRLHRQNALAQYEWEFATNAPTAVRTFAPTTAAQKLVLRHYASDHHLDAAIDNGAFVASAAPAPFTVKPLTILGLYNSGFSAFSGDWTLFNLLIAEGLYSQAELEAVA